MVQLTVRRIGNSLGVILPQEALSQLRVGEGDRLILSESADGMKLTPHNPDFERKMKIAEDIVRKYRDTIRELAK